MATKSTQKKIIVKNDGFCKNKKSAAVRCNEALNRYLEKMSVKGWIPTSVCGGNEFFYYAEYVTLVKPTSEKDILYYQNLAVKNGFSLKNGKWGW